MLHLDEERSGKSSDFSCIIDSAYKMPLWIEVYTTQFHEQVISFHEMNWYNQKYQNIYTKQNELLCIPDNAFICGIGETAPFDISVQKGLCRLELRVYGIKVSSECVQVKKSDYNAAILTECNKLVDAALEDNDFQFEFSDEKQLSFTSYGSRLQNEISLLLDLYDATLDSRVTAPLALKVEALESYPNYKSVRDALLNKYKSYKGIDYSYLI
jgi:hypothetical protein